MPKQTGLPELPIPPEAGTAAGSSEVLRAWIVNGGLTVSLISAFDRPALWGMLLADVARHAARCFEADGICAESDAMQQIVDMLAAELASPTDLGSTTPLQSQ
jgi:hypothetical protein